MMYEGTRPPENSMVKNIIQVRKRRAGKCLSAITYENMDITVRLITVPTMV